MDFRKETPFLVFLVACACYVQGARLSEPENLQVSIMEKGVMVHWDMLTDAPFDFQYKVEFGRYGSKNWTVVDKCSTHNFCYITDLIEDYTAAYKVRVQLVAGDVCSEWAKKKFLLNSSELQPPAFTMWATSSTLTVNIHQNHILRNVFGYGVIYTIVLEEKGQNKSIIINLRDDILDPKNEKTFTSLNWGKEYCVSVKVEGIGETVKSPFNQKCIVLPEQEWIIISIASLTVSAFLIITAFITIVILCYLKRPVKTPPTLKSPTCEWRPLSVGEGPVEVVTDRGWFLFSKAELTFKNIPTTYISDQQYEEEERRPSTDSGVSVKSKTSVPATRKDSGCGSLGAQDSICSHFPNMDEGSDALSTTKTEDSGMGLSCHSDASSLNLEEQDSGCLNKSNKYQSQKQLSVSVIQSEDIFKEKHPEPQLVSVVSGYRTNASLCTCSGVTLCIWCQNQSNYRGKYKGQLQNGNIVQSYSSYCSNNTTINMSQTENSLTLEPMEETFPMLTSLSSFPLMEKGQDLNMNDVSISLCDVEINSY